MMKLTDLIFYPNVPVKTVDGIGLLTGIPDYNAKSNIIKVKFSKTAPKPHALDCGKLQEYWDTVDYGFYVLNNQNQIILKEILHITEHDAKLLGYDTRLFPLDFLRRTLYEKLIFNGFTISEFKTLCHLHIDMFRWIEKGIALSNKQFNMVQS